MADHDFHMSYDAGGVEGGFNFEQLRKISYFQPIVIALLIVILIFIWVVLGRVEAKEKMSCLPGNDSALCRQGRDGSGESLTNSALAQGFGADPTSFCAGAGQATSDPWDMMYAGVTETGTYEDDEREKKEKKEKFSSPTDLFDQNAMLAAAGY